MGKTKSLPFKWSDFFVPSDTECLLACFAMSARYWAEFFPELKLAKDLDVWKEFANRSFVSYRGTYIKEFLRKIPKSNEVIEVNSEIKTNNLEEPTSQVVEFSELAIKTNTLEDLNSLVPFFRTKIIIPQIIFFNQLLMTHNINGPNHAVLLHSIDFEKEKLYVIDSTKHQMQEPDVYDFHQFKRAWRDAYNLQIITYPKDMITLVSGPNVGITKQLYLNQFTEKSK